jgi:NAD(P) transhydrogenase subunit beta
MRRAISQQLSFGDGFIDPGLYRLDEEVQKVDELLSQGQLLKPFEEVFDQTMGTVKYAIHPVAGRIPGHMNVLLAEADVPYYRLFDIDAINDEFASTDVALVVGANDVVNPAAKHDPSSPIYGMPVLDAELARTVIVLKRTMNPGFAKIENELFLRPNTMMLFGDANKTLTEMVRGLKEMS